MSLKSLNMMLRFMPLRSVRPCDPSQALRNGSQIAPYHCSKSLSWPGDSGSKPAVKLQPSAFSGASLRSRAKVSSEWEDDPEHSVVPRKLRSKVTRKISPELHTLSFDDIPEGNQKALRTPKEDKTLVTNKRDDVVFGLSPCLLALTQGRRKVSRLFVKDGEDQQRDAVRKVCEEAMKRDVQIKWVQKRDLDKISNGRVHQGICLQASPLQYLREWSGKPKKTAHRNQIPLWLVLDGIQDPMNLGAILRSAYFLGVDRIASSLQNRYMLYLRMYVIIDRLSGSMLTYVLYLTLAVPLHLS